MGVGQAHSWPGYNSTSYCTTCLPPAPACNQATTQQQSILLKSRDSPSAHAAALARKQHMSMCAGCSRAPESPNNVTPVSFPQDAKCMSMPKGMPVLVPLMHTLALGVARILLHTRMHSPTLHHALFPTFLCGSGCASQHTSCAGVGSLAVLRSALVKN